MDKIEKTTQNLIEYYKDTGKVPTVAFAKENGLLLVDKQILGRRFGGWRKYLNSIGIVVKIPKPPRPSLSLNCKQCELSIMVKQSYYDNSTSKNFFCSNSCSARFNNAKR